MKKKIFKEELIYFLCFPIVQMNNISLAFIG